MSLAFRKIVEDSNIPKDKQREVAREMCRADNFGDGRTKQSFKDECDINKILEKAARTGMVSHLSKYQQQYGDLEGVDLQNMMDTVAHANTLFAELPAEVRNEFNNNQQAFFDYVNDPENKDKLAEKLPALAAPGRQLPNPDRTKEPVKMGATSDNAPSKAKDEPKPAADKAANDASAKAEAS